ncbi:MAG: adenosylmethionine--8-amino-7-oxononanoate transaminase, partial [Victivallales bacterium]|nr:adenosylmethionine--8-amino-7-oxononanoate transaminase [Victivallales bacterium]
PPLAIESARGPFLYTKDGREVIDAISSWWCKSLGHCHPRIRAAVERQLDKFEHVILANTTNETIAAFAAELAGICPGLDRVFLADNGSTAVEVAMKMSLQYHAQTGTPERNTFLALHNGYHGETILTLAAGDCEMYSRPFARILPRIAKTAPLVYCTGPDRPGWDKYPDAAWNEMERQLDELAPQLAAVIFEPVVQGAGGMKIYSPDLLRRFRAWADRHHVHLIADEIMTGFARCGRMLACEYAGIVPDFVTLSKSMTAGWGPMSAILCSSATYNAFYGDYFSDRAFVHSNTYTGYPVTAAATLAALKIYREELVVEKAPEKCAQLRRLMEYVARETGALSNIRAIGYLAAAEIVDPDSGMPFDRRRRIGFQLAQQAAENGALLRPIGDTLYFLPPFNTPDVVLERMAEIAARSLRQVIDPA